MKVLRLIRNCFFYFGIEKDEYNAIKKDAYISNFNVWKILHFLMAALFGALFIVSLRSELMKTNRLLYLLAFVYSVIAIVLFFSYEERLDYRAIPDLFVDFPAVFVWLCPFHQQA